MSTVILCIDCTLMHRRIVVVGGFKQYLYSHTVWRLDLITNSQEATHIIRTFQVKSDLQPTLAFVKWHSFLLC